MIVTRYLKIKESKAFDYQNVVCFFGAFNIIFDQNDFLKTEPLIPKPIQTQINFYS